MSLIAAQGYALRRAAALLGGRPWRFLLGIVAAAIAVALLLAVATVALGVAPQIARLKAGPQINVFVTIGTGQRELDELQARLAALDGAPAVRLIPRAKAFAELSQRAGATAAEPRSNPLPDVLVAQYALGVDPAVVERAATSVRDWAGVDAVQSDLGWYRRLAALANAGGIFAATAGPAAVLLALLALLAAAAAQVRLTRDETAVLRTAGASTAFIVRPHACAAALTLGLGATMALALLAVVLSSAQPQLAAAVNALGAGFAWPRWPAWTPVAVVAAAAALGWGVGWISAYRASHAAPM